MLGQFRKIAKTVTGFIFSRKNANAARMAGATAIDLATGAINIAVPVLAVDYFKKKDSADGSNQSDNGYVPYLAVGALLLAQVLPKARNMLLNSVRANVQKELTQAMVVKSYNLELNHQLTERTGEFAQALSKNYSSVDKGIPSFFGEVIPSSTEILATSVFLMTRYGAVGAIELAVFGVYLFTASILEKGAAEIRNKCVVGSYKAYGDVIAALGNYLPAHQFGNVDYELNKIDASLANSEVLYSQTHRKDDINALILSLINGTGFVGILAFAALLPPNSSFELVDFALVAYYISRFNNSLNSLSPAISTFHTALTDAEKVVDFLNKQPKISDAEDAVDLEIATTPTIEFKNVTFRYEQKLILDDVSFIINAGKKFAIVGPTGAGKSTILNLLLGFYKPDSGQIFVAGQDIATLTAKSLRKYMTVVAQSSTIFNDTVRENIRYGYLDATDAEVDEAAQMAELEPQKLAAAAGQNGGKLSGGERQRATIARALLKSGLIYLLDEPTRELDPTTERDVQNKLDDLTTGTTTLLVTHRLNTVTNADTIVYIDDAKIAEQGDFLSLMQSNGKFSQQFNVQCHELGIDPASIKPLRVISSASSSSSSSSSSTPVSQLKGQTFWLRRRAASGNNALALNIDQQYGAPNSNTSPDTPLLSQLQPSALYGINGNKK